MGGRVQKFTACVIIAIGFMAQVEMLSAQAEKGMLIIGGNTNISESIKGTANTFNLTLAPSFGAFVINNFAIGGIYSFGCSSARTLNATTEVRTTTTTFNTLVGPFLKYYFGKKAMKPFISTNAGYTVFTQIRSNNVPNSSASLANYDGFSVSGSAGIAYFLNRHIAIESALYLTATGAKTQLPTTNFGFSLGLYAFLDKKKQE